LVAQQLISTTWSFVPTLGVNAVQSHTQDSYSQKQITYLHIFQHKKPKKANHNK
jgi:hypothetical protein